MSLPSTTRAIVVASVVGGTGALLTSIFTGRASTTVSSSQWIEAAVIGVLMLGSWIRPFVLFRNGQSSAYHMDEGLFAMLALLLPPLLVLATLAVVVTVAQLVRRRPFAKSAFNWGQVLVAAGLGLAVSRSVAVPTKPITWAEVAAAMLGVAVYFIVNTVLITGVMVTTGSSWRIGLLDDLSIQVSLAGVGFIVAVILVLAVQSRLWALVFAVPAMLVLSRLVTARFLAQQDRARIQGLYDVTIEANSRLREDAVLEAVLDSAREQLRCSHAELVESAPGVDGAENPGFDALAAPIEISGRIQWLVVSGRRREEPFEAADRILLEAVAAIAKGALTNAELYRQVIFERGRLASVTLNIGEGVCAVDSDGNLTFVNPAAATIIDIPNLRIPVGDSAPTDAMQAPGFLLAPARAAMRTGGVLREEDAVFIGPSGELIPVAYTASAVRQGGDVVGAVISFRDITERKKLEESMTHQALYDSLTGLANRRLLVERLENALERSRRDHRLHALIFIDVDRFKAINDSLGHGTGDDLLVTVGARMQDVLRAEDLVARFGGDEFVVLLEDISGTEEAINAARRICSAVEEPLVLPDGYEIVASVSVGIALTEPGQSADDILRDADVAMYKAKGRGGTYQLFDRSVMGNRSSERIDLEAALRKGLDRGELEVHYQPLVSINDLTIVGAEALVRWRHPVEGLLSPDRFIPLAEETGLILPLGRQVLEQACAQVRKIRDEMGVDLPVSVNLSPRQFQQSSLLTDVATVLDNAGLPSHLLAFEITETMVMDDIAGATEIMKKLNRLGVHLAIDDFGTGHSSLGYLKQFPVQEVKVDRTFVRGVAGDPVDSAIVRAVVDLADAMGIIAVAEGVETKEQLAGLRMLGCHVGQGYYFGKPLPPDLFDELLEQNLALREDEAEPRASLRIV